MRATGAALVFLVLSLSFTVLAQDPPAVWAGVYTAAQAERGRTVVQNHCSECHHDDLSGGEGPALAGPIFMLKWETHSVERLFHKIRDTMPSRGSTEVSEKEKLDTVAYILQQNGFPPGDTELTDASPAFASIRLLPKEGPAAPRSGALVQVIGCLQEKGANAWMLSQSTDPQVTTLDPVPAADKEAMAAAGAGGQTIELMSVYPNPAALRQHKVLVKGLLIKTDSATRVNVTSLVSLSPSCP
jgi:mono/diheme cytochrome c family protein